MLISKNSEFKNEENSKLSLSPMAPKSSNNWGNIIKKH
jgi:hypothetical protein